MDSVYFKAALVQPPKIAGIQLRPFSLWHAMMLIGLGNPVIGFDPLQVQMAHVVQAMLICKDGFRDALASVLRHTNSPLYQWFIAWRVAKYGPRAAAKEFFQYLSAYRETPEYWRGSGDTMSRILGPFRTAGTLISHTSLSEDRVWDMPFGLARSYEACIAEDNGAKLVDPAELDKADAAIESFGKATNAGN